MPYFFVRMPFTSVRFCRYMSLNMRFTVAGFSRPTSRSSTRLSDAGAVGCVIACGIRFLHTFRLLILHCKIDGRDSRILGIIDIESEKSAVFGDDRQVCFCCEIPHGGFHAHDVLGSIGLAGDDVHRADVDIRDRRREEDVYSLGESRFDLFGVRSVVGPSCMACRRERVPPQIAETIRGR